MANRLTDTEIWRKMWFRQLSPKMKCVFKYFVDNCDHSGILEIDFDLISFQVGDNISRDDLVKFQESFEFEWIGEFKIFIPSFILYQCKVSSYNELKPYVNAHKAPIKALIDLGRLPKGFGWVGDPFQHSGIFTIPKGSWFLEPQSL